MATNHPTSNHQPQTHKQRYLKLIGAFQHGTSSMAAALLLEAIPRTHDIEHRLFALLDLQQKGVGHA